MQKNLELDFVAYCNSRGIKFSDEQNYLGFVDVWWVRVFIGFFDKKDSVPTQYVDSGLLSRLCIHLSERVTHCQVDVEQYQDWGVVYEVLKRKNLSSCEFNRRLAAMPFSFAAACDLVKMFKFCVFYTRSEIPEEVFVWDCVPL